MIRVAAFEGLEALVYAAGVDFGAVLRQAGLDRADVAEPDHRISYRRYVSLLNAAAAATADDLLGLHLGSAQSIRVTGVLGYAVQASPDVRTTVTQSTRYLALHQTGSAISLRDDGRIAEYQYSTFDPRATQHRHDSELTLALVVAQWRVLTGLAKWSPASAHFEHGRPACAAEIERFFGCPVHFSQPFDGLRFASVFLDTPLVSADRGLHGILTRHAEERLARHDGISPLSGLVERQIAAALRNGSASIESVARGLAMTPRTLQRRLKDDGLQFSQMVDEIRRGLAEQYLRDPGLGLTDTAFLIGYSDLTAFHRAFRRWFQQTPAEYKKQVAAEARRADV